MVATLFTEKQDGLPVFEGRMVDLYDYRAKGYARDAAEQRNGRDLPFGDPRKAILPQWRILRADIPITHCLVSTFTASVSADVGSPTNERSLIAAIVPPNTVCGDSVPTIVFERAVRPICFFGLVSRTL